jgi:hypothetical protein
MTSAPTVSTQPRPLRRVRVYCYCPWADRLEAADDFLRELPARDLSARIANPADPSLMRMARIDCDWHAETVRVCAAMVQPGIEFLPSKVLGAKGLADLVSLPASPDEERWFVLTAQHPKEFAGVAGRVLAQLQRQRIHTFYYAFDEASRSLGCFNDIAPHLDVLIHDESPLATEGRAALSARCLAIHRSWVANLLPFGVPFNEQPESKILFLGSRLGFTPHRRRQVEFLQKKFKDRMVAIHDHSVAVSAQRELARLKVSICPEGRMFATPGMRFTHTDRPFWSGCFGMVPVCEDSKEGGRLEALHQERLILRHAHGSLSDLARACDEALALPTADRRRIYDYFNRHETVGAVIAAAIGEWHARNSPGT